MKRKLEPTSDVSSKTPKFPGLASETTGSLSSTTTLTTTVTTTITQIQKLTTTIPIYFDNHSSLFNIIQQVPVPKLAENSIAITRVLYQRISSPYVIVYDFNTPELTGRKTLRWNPKFCSTKGLKLTNFVDSKTTFDCLKEKKIKLNIPWQESGRCENTVLDFAVAKFNRELTRELMTTRCESFDLLVRQLKMEGDGKKCYWAPMEKTEQNELCNLLNRYHVEMPLLMDIIKSDPIAALLSEDLIRQIKKDHPIPLSSFSWISISQLKEWLIAQKPGAHGDPKVNSILEMIDVLVDSGWPIEKQLFLSQDQFWGQEQLDLE